MTDDVKRCTIDAVRVRRHAVTGVSVHQLGLGVGSPWHPSEHNAPASLSSPRRRRARSWRVVTAVLFASLVATSSGCRSGGANGRIETTRPTATTSSTTSASAVDPTTAAAVLSGYRAFWDVWKAASNPMNPSHPRLPEVAVGAQYQQLVTLFAAHLDAHEVFMGEIDLRPVVESLKDGEAVVFDCMLDGQGIYDTRTNPPTRRDRPEDGRIERRTTMRLVDGKWKAAHVGPIGAPCGP